MSNLKDYYLKKKPYLGEGKLAADGNSSGGEVL